MSGSSRVLLSSLRSVSPKSVGLHSEVRDILRGTFEGDRSSVVERRVY